MSRFAFAGRSHRGLVRAGNEDAWLADAERGLFIVADGMGAHKGGEIASRLVVEGLPALLQGLDVAAPDSSRTKALATVALDELNRRVRAEGRVHPEVAGLGATVVAALALEAGALVVHLGDSRAYLARDGAFDAITRDHSIVQYLVDLGEITPAEARLHPAKHQVSRYVGMGGEVLPDVSFVPLEPGHRLLLCSDGLTRMLEDEEISTILSRHPSPDAASQALIEAANGAGGRDNTTLIVVDWGGGDR